MDDPTTEKHPPKVFISYSWDSESHKQWVKDFASRLRAEDGVDVTLDQWDAVPGDQLPAFMEKAVRESDFVLCICTPRYKEKSDKRGGGVGYEEDVITGEVLYSQDQRKFIPILRIGRWEDAAPTWMLGKYAIDLCGDKYIEQNYQDLLKTLQSNREKAPPLASFPPDKVESRKDSQPNGVLARRDGNGNSTFEFVNRDIELAALDPAKLSESYWQCALVSAPTGYGKTRLLERLIDQIQNQPELRRKWDVRYVDLKPCEDLNNLTRYIARVLTGKEFASEVSEEELKDKIGNYVLEEMSKSVDDASPRNVLLILDTIELLPSKSIPWLSSVIHDLVVDSYIDYEKDDCPFAVRFIVSGVDAVVFWNSYSKWEESTDQHYRLRPPRQRYLSPLSPFDKLAINDFVTRRVKKEGVPISSSIPEISRSLQFISGGHPEVISKILDELAVRKFRGYKDYIKNNRENLVRTHISKVAKKILLPFHEHQVQKDIRTVCVLRLNDLNTLEKMWSEKLLSFPGDINFLKRLCNNKILKPPSKDIPFYHDDIIRRIIYLDFKFGIDREDEHVQKVHQCAKSLYGSWIEAGADKRSIHYFFDEWLFHALQINYFADDAIASEWKLLLSKLQAVSLPVEDLRQTILEQLEADDEVKYLYRERFGSEDFSRLFEL